MHCEKLKLGINIVTLIKNITAVVEYNILWNKKINELLKYNLKF